MSVGGCMKILHLTLKKQWFDLIASGLKDEEYRELKQYWHARLQNKHYDAIEFRNGYQKNAPTMTVELKIITIGLGNPSWGAPETEEVYILKLGKILEVRNGCACND